MTRATPRMICERLHSYRNEDGVVVIATVAALLEALVTLEGLETLVAALEEGLDLDALLEVALDRSEGVGGHVVVDLGLVADVSWKK